MCWCLLTLPTYQWHFAPSYPHFQHLGTTSGHSGVHGDPWWLFSILFSVAQQDLYSIIPVCCFRRNGPEEGYCQESAGEGGHEGVDALGAGVLWAVGQSPRPVWPAFLPQPWAALEHGRLWPTPSLSRWQGALGNGSYWETKVSSLASPRGPRTGGGGCASSRAQTVCGALGRCRGREAQGRVGHCQGHPCPDCWGPVEVREEGEPRCSCSACFSATRLGAQSNQKSSLSENRSSVPIST